MADEGDRAQEAYDEFHSGVMAKRARTRAADLQNLPKCENHEDCGSRVFVTEKGTIARFCKPCWEEFRANR